MKVRYDNLRKLDLERSQMNAQREDYVAMMVHELRSPLAVIKGSADLLIKEHEALTQEQNDTMLSQIHESSSDLLAIVNDILDVSKIESGRFEVKLDVGNLNKTLQDEANYYAALAEQKEIRVETQLDENIPELKFDSDRVKHILNNLLSNAIKFTDNGGSVVIKSRMRDEKVEISVSDTGQGVPDNMKSKLFNKFVQMENRRHSKEKGTGLGLVIAKGIVEAHGGQIWVEDNDPQGARFVFTIPIS